MAGGGLEPINKELMKFYKEKYNLEWNSEREILWPKLVADKMGYTLHDYSKSGAGIERYIRETYDYIYEDFNRADETIYFIELPVIWNKVDMWSNIHNRYLLCNTDLKTTNDVGDPYDPVNKELIGTFKDLHLCDDYWYQSTEERAEIEKVLVPTLRESFKKTWRPKQYEKKILKNLIGLLGYMKYKKYKFYILPSAIQIAYIHKFISDIYDNILNFYDENGSHIGNDFHNWSSQYDMRITDETDGNFIDTHPGYFAHQKWANMIIEKLKKENEKII